MRRSDRPGSPSAAAPSPRGTPTAAADILSWAAAVDESGLEARVAVHALGRIVDGWQVCFVRIFGRLWFGGGGGVQFLLAACFPWSIYFKIQEWALKRNAVLKMRIR